MSENTGNLRTATALKHGVDRSSRITARGEGELADMMIALAKQHDIPLLEDFHLSHKLRDLPLGTELPDELFIALSRLLEYLDDCMQD